MESLIIDSDFVKDKIGKPGWVLVDVRFTEDFDKGHIPGAVGLPGWLSKIFAADTKRQSTVLAQIEQTLGDMGIDKDSHVIVYGDPVNVGWNGVLFWILEAFGCNSSLSEGTVQFYDGGVNRWQADGGMLDQTSPTVKPVQYKAVEGARRGAKADEIIHILEGKEKGFVLDARTPAEFNGTDVKALRGGHIPETVNIDFMNNFDPTTFRMLPLEKLNYLYKDVPKNQRVIVYCQTGARASYTYLVLRALGYQDVANYHDGWRVYGSDLKLPVQDETWYDFTKINVMMNIVNQLQKKMQ